MQLTDLELYLTDDFQKDCSLVSPYEQTTVREGGGGGGGGAQVLTVNVVNSPSASKSQDILRKLCRDDALCAHSLEDLCRRSQLFPLHIWDHLVDPSTTS